MSTKVVEGDNLMDNVNKRREGFITTKGMGRGKFLEMMARGGGIIKSTIVESMDREKILKMNPIECIVHQQKKNQAIPHCRKCCPYELWAPPDNRVTTYSGDMFIN